MKREREKSEYEKYLQNAPEINAGNGELLYDPIPMFDGYYTREYIRRKADHDYEKYNHSELAAAGNPYARELVNKAAQRANEYKRLLTDQYKNWYKFRKGKHKYQSLHGRGVKGASSIILKKFANRWLWKNRRMARLASIRRMAYAKMPVPGLPGHKRLYNKDIGGLIEKRYMNRKFVKGFGIRRNKM